MRIARTALGACIAATVGAVIHSGVAAAQNTGSQVAGPAGTDPSAPLQEIIITAEKRATDIQTTPISVSAITGRELDSLGIGSVATAVESVPGISYSSAGPGQTQYEIRGLSNDGGQSPTVGFYLDEIPVSPPVVASVGKVAIDPDLYDLARVEVLRGPQGTLFGAGSMGGTIRLITNEPDAKAFSVKGESILSGTEGGGVNYGQNGMVNIPLVHDRVALRVVGTYKHTAGWIDRVVVPGLAPDGQQRADVFASPVSADYHNVNDENLSGARATLLFEPVDGLSLDVMAFHQRIDQGAQNLFDSVPGTLAHYQPIDVPESFADTFSLYSLTANYRLSWVKLTSATGYSDRATTTYEDDTEDFQDGFGAPAYDVADGGYGPVAASELDRTHQFSEEVRATSAGSGRLQWIVGAFYSKFKADTGLDFPSPGALEMSGGATGSIALIDEPNAITQRAEFVNVNYQASRLLRLTAGLRHFSYSSNEALGSGGLVNTGTSMLSYTYANASNSGNSPMFNIALFPSEQLMLYATASKGFREGGPNYPLASPDTPEGQQCLGNLQTLGLSSVPLQFGPDTVWTYELGEKATLFDHQATLNSDVYYTRWNGVQQPVALPCGETFTINAANAYVAGGELEFQGRLWGGFRLTQSVGYSYAAFSQNSVAADVAKGERLLDVPNWTISTAVEYFHDLGPNLLLIGRASNSFVSWFNDLTYGINRVPSRDLTDFRIGLEDGKLSGFLFVDNLLNRQVILAHVPSLSLNIPAYDRLATTQPRTIGINLNYSF